MMHSGQRLPSSGIIAPVSQPRSGEVEARWDLPFEGIPCACDVRRPEDCSVALRAQISVAREDKPAMRRIVAETIVNRACVKERIHVEVLRAGADVKIAAVWR